MSGFVGFILDQARVLSQPETVLVEMMNRMKHRGPGLAYHSIDGDIALGMRKIVGSAPQRMTFEGRYKVAYSGEIYNSRDIRHDLESMGHSFETEDETEIFLKAYLEYGPSIFSKFRGPFALVLWDGQEKEAVMARDVFGIQPFYYSQHTEDASFLFGSEIKSFLTYPYFIKELNENAIQPYLTFQYNPLNETFFKGVYKLQPAHYMRVREGQIIEEREYHHLVFDGTYDRSLSLEAYAEEIEGALKESIQSHIPQEGKTGTFLSGGVDSSMITAMADRETSYSIGFENYEAMFNETDLAQDLSRQLGIENKRRFVSEDEVFEAMETIVYHLDEPDANPSIVALYFLAALASQDVDVVLSGEGADELFGGYHWYKPSKLSDRYTKLPLSVRKKLAQWFAGSGGSRLSEFLKRDALDVEDRFIGHAIIFTNDEVAEVLKVPYKKGLRSFELTAPYYDRVQGQSDLDKMQHLDLHLWNPGDILLKADKMTMAHSLEARTPFLDAGVWQVAKKLPEEYRVDYSDTKLALRQAAEHVLPDEWAHRKKLGFPVPIRHWLRKDPFYSQVKAMFKSPQAGQFFNQDLILQLLEDHKEEKKDNGRKVWTLYTFLLWYQTYFVEDGVQVKSLQI